LERSKVLKIDGAVSPGGGVPMPVENTQGPAPATVPAAEGEDKRMDVEDAKDERRPSLEKDGNGDVNMEGPAEGA
jgi:hypothetical protein